MDRLIRFLIVMTIFILVFVSVKVRSICIELEAAIGRARLEKMALTNKQKLLIAEKEKLLSLQRVRYIASKELGLAELDRTKVVFILQQHDSDGNMDVRFKNSLGSIN